MAINTAQDLLNELAEIKTEQIREDMKKDIHVIILSVAEFAKLVRLHLSEVRKIANRSEDQDIRAQLNNGSKRNPGKLAKRLQMRFIEIFEKQLRTQSKLEWKKKVQGNVTLYFIQSNGKVFNQIRDNVMSPVRKQLVTTSARGSIDRVLSLIIAGIDIDEDTDIGDTSLGEFAKSKQLSGAPSSVSSKSYPAKGIKKGDTIFAKGAGVQLGHTRGPNTVAAKRRLELILEAQRNIIGLTGTFFEARQLVDVVHKFDAEMRFNDVVYNIAKGLTGRVDISIITLESAAANQFSGGKAKAALGKLTKFLRDNAKKIVTQKGSKPIVDLILKDYEVLFTTGKSPKTKRVNRVYKKRVTVKGKASSSAIKFKTRNKTEKLLALLVGDSDENGVGTADIIALLNDRLGDKIRQNMGKGNATQILNWRTGRLEQSAVVKNLISSKDKNTLVADVKYHGPPYDRFQNAGDPLFKPGRRIDRLFGRSIRQILQETKIANLKRVKVRLHNG